MLDSQGRFVRWNRLLEEVTGLTAEMLHGTDALSTISADDRELVAGKIREVFEKGQAEVEARFLGKDEVRDYWFTGRRMDVGSTSYLVGSGVDITGRKRAEEALQRTTAELARSNRDLEQFAYVASHDLQEPLRTVSGFARLLQQKYGNRLDPEANQFIEYAVDGAKRMQALIRDLLAYARVGSGDLEPAPTDAGAALQTALSNLESSIRETAAEITHGELPTVRADAGQLVQLFQNLIGNALKYRGEAPPQIHVDACRKEDHWLFSVRDNGIGIDPKHQDRIFQVFQRLHTRTQYDGTGIGLAICKKIVDRHGGRIWVESQPGPGATFSFTLPT